MIMYMYSTCCAYTVHACNIYAVKNVLYMYMYVICMFYTL